ncbi:hypothetical protein CI238_02496 [Colletotrichum incanum]|uniref:Uncharacterized protein n=1 Tax=Colletotrichum incanum TaxID=1573173 RepID=A0A161WL29_COLIC|nr:hypothetical protein CI238_02496 [Colletotrichum incanum]
MRKLVLNRMKKIGRTASARFVVREESRTIDVLWSLHDSRFELWSSSMLARALWNALLRSSDGQSPPKRMNVYRGTTHLNVWTLGIAHLTLNNQGVVRTPYHAWPSLRAKATHVIGLCAGDHGGIRAKACPQGALNSRVIDDVITIT